MESSTGGKKEKKTLVVRTLQKDKNPSRSMTVYSDFTKKVNILRIVSIIGKTYYR